MTTCCIFDLDGTLINSLEDLADSCNYALEVLEFPTHDVPSYKQFVGDGIFKLMERILPEHARNDINAKSVKKLFDAYYEKHYLDKTRAYSGISELIRLLWEKDIRTAVVSNKPDEFVQKIVSQLFTAPPIDLVLGQSAQIPKKPDPTGVKKVLERLNIPKEECLYIGDSDVDVQTAQNAGIRCIGAAWGFRGEGELRNAGADAVIGHPMDVLELLDHE